MKIKNQENQRSEEMFSWEKEFKKKWTLEEKEIEKQFETKNIHRKFNRSIIRHLNVIVDFSKSIEEIDFKPTNKLAIMQALESFKNIFLIENPLSIFSITFYQKNKSQFFTKDMSFNNKLPEGEGYFDLQKAVEFSLKNMNDSFIKEFVIITCSISNSGNLPSPVKMSFINLNAEVEFFKKLSYNENYFVPLDNKQLEDALIKISEPEAVNSKTPVGFIRAFFPKIVKEISLCTCHQKITYSGYLCLCGAKICSVPFQCPICDKQLVSSLVLAQNAYHYTEIFFNATEKEKCETCDSKAHFECEKCKKPFCFECKFFIETTTRFCPFC